MYSNWLQIEVEKTFGFADAWTEQYFEAEKAAMIARCKAKDKCVKFEQVGFFINSVFTIMDYMNNIIFIFFVTWPNIYADEL